MRIIQDVQIREGQIIWVPLYVVSIKFGHSAVADTGFPMGGRPLRRGGADSRGGFVLKILFVETKESGPLGWGTCAGHAPLDPPMHWHVVLKLL